MQHENDKSELLNIDCGLLQGDNLSQTFFLLVINDVTQVIKHSKFHLYADDQSLYIHCKPNNLNETINLINNDIKNINNWMKSHGLQLNPTKTQTILISSPQIINHIDYSKTKKIEVNNFEIEFSNQVKYLGYNFNTFFDSKNHVDSIIKKVNYSLDKIKHCKKSIPKES